MGLTTGIIVVPVVSGDAFLGDQVGFVGGLAGSAALAVLIYLVIVVGKLTVNTLNAYGGFMCILTTVSAFNLTDYYVISKERVDIPALYDPAGRYGSWNLPALACYVIGVVVQIPFLAQKLYTGPITNMLGGADISWIVGLVVTAALYYFVVGRRTNAPTKMIYPAKSPVSV